MWETFIEKSPHISCPFLIEHLQVYITHGNQTLTQNILFNHVSWKLTGFGSTMCKRERDRPSGNRSHLQGKGDDFVTHWDYAIRNYGGGGGGKMGCMSQL